MAEVESVARSAVVEESPRVGATGDPQPRLPPVLACLLGFLLTDTTLLLYRLLTHTSETDMGRPFLDQRSSHDLVAAGFGVVLMLHLYFRAPTARLWGTTYFLCEIGLHVATFVFRQPEEWHLLTVSERLQTLVRLLCFTSGVFLLNGAGARAYLRRARHASD